jgi:selenocysteine lyase/cysteine desulfurase
MYSSLKPGETWGLATVGVDGMKASEISAALWDRRRIIVAALAQGELPGQQFEYQGIRVTPNIYTTIGEVDTFVEAMREIARYGIRESRIPKIRESRNPRIQLSFHA